MVLMTKICFTSSDKPAVNSSTCKEELSIYTEVKNISCDNGTYYDVKKLNIFIDIGDAFLNAIIRKSLFGEC